jgi:thiamine biosynthesis lipoprotein
VEVLLDGPCPVEEVENVVRGSIEVLDGVASRFRADSEVNALLAGAGQGWQPISPTLTELLAAAVFTARYSDHWVVPTLGAALVEAGYDRDFADLTRPTVEVEKYGAVANSSPLSEAGLKVATCFSMLHLDVVSKMVILPPGCRLDLGSSGKAVWADRLARELYDRFELPTLVSLGGDVAVVGGGSGFSVGIAEDHSAGQVEEAIRVFAGGVATSSITRRRWTQGGQPRHHLIDPRTGRPATQSRWRTATVAAGSCLVANAAATAVLIRNDDGLEWLEQRQLAARLVGVDGHIESTSYWPRWHEAGQPGCRP